MLPTDTAAAAKSSTPSTRANGLADHQFRVASVLLADRDAPFYLEKLACGSLYSVVSDAVAAIDVLLDLLASPVGPGPTPGDRKHIAAARAHVAAASTETAASAKSRRITLAAKSLADYAKSTGAGKDGALVIATSEAAGLATGALTQLDSAYEQILTQVGYLSDMMASLPRCAEVTAGHSLAQAEEVLAQIYSGKPGPSEAAMLALSASSSLKRTQRIPDLTAAKWEGTLTPTGGAARAQVRGTGSSPFNIPAAATLELVLDGTPATLALPARTGPSLLVGPVPLTAGTVTPVAGVSDTFKLNVDGAETSVTLLAVPTTVDQLVTQLGALSGVAAQKEQDVFIRLTSATSGYDTWVSVLNGNGNVWLGATEGATARGSGVSVLDIQVAAADQGTPVYVSGATISRGVLSVVGDGSTSVACTPPSGTEEGDTVQLSASSGQAVVYKVVSVAESALELDRAVAAGTYRASVWFEPLVLVSTTAGAGSEVTVLTGPSVLGIAPKAAKSLCAQASYTGGDSTWPIRVGDVVIGSDLDTQVTRAAAGSLTLASGLLGAQSAKVYPAGYRSHAALLVGLTDWENDPAHVTTINELKLADPLARAVKGGSPSVASTICSGFRAHLVQLQTLLSAYAAAESPALGAVLRALSESGLDRTLDVLLQGNLGGFLGLTDSDSTYAGDVAKSALELGELMPMSMSDLSAIASVQSYAPSFVDSEEDDDDNDELPVVDDDGGLLVF